MGAGDYAKAVAQWRPLADAGNATRSSTWRIPNHFLF
jgi:hypothetical protein